MKWTNTAKLLIISTALAFLLSCERVYDICSGEKEFVLCEKDSFFTAFSRFDTAFYELTIDGSRKSIEAYLIKKDTVFSKNTFGCVDNCSYYETEVLQLERLDGLHVFTFSNNKCAKRLLNVRYLNYDFDETTVFTTKNRSVILSLDSGLMFFQASEDYVLKRIR